MEDIVIDMIGSIMRALYAMEYVSRRLTPAALPWLIDALVAHGDQLEPAIAVSRAHSWPKHLELVRDRLEKTAQVASETIAEMVEAPKTPQPMISAYRALRGYAKAVEALYPLAAHLKQVSWYFLESQEDHDILTARLAGVDPQREKVGVMHVGGPPGTRGAFSLYVPEYYDAARALPLVVAMHGGSGNGGAFLWSWLREARTRGFAVIAPTAIGSTWSLMDPEVDRPNIDDMVKQVAEQWNIDPKRRLLTGMSDGGTFTYVLGLRGDCRFTHLAPIAASFHPMLMSFADADRVRGLPIHIVHGAQDWMFSPEMARSAQQTLEQAGAQVIYREIADLSHTYPRDENAVILDWFLR